MRAVRRRGYTPEALRGLCERVGVSKRDGVVDISLLEHYVREDLNATSPRVLGILKPLRVTLTNVGETTWIEAAEYFKDEPARGTRRIPFGKEILIERDDFKEVPVKGWWRLSPGLAVRLRHACSVIRCDEIIKDAAGEVTGLRCTLIDSESPEGKALKVKATIGWLAADHAVPIEARLYDRLFTTEDPQEGGDYRANINPEARVDVRGFVEPSMRGAAPGTRVQFERIGYFCVDQDSTPELLVVNRTIGLRDSWARQEQKL